MKKGISTIIATIIMVVITIGLISTAYLYFSGLIGGMTEGTISLVDAYCALNDHIYVIAKNEGTAEIASLSCVINGAACTDGGGSDCTTVPVGGVCTWNISNVNPDTINQIRVIGANSVGGPVECK